VRKRWKQPIVVSLAEGRNLGKVLKFSKISQKYRQDFPPGFRIIVKARNARTFISVRELSPIVMYRPVSSRITREESLDKWMAIDFFNAQSKWNIDMPILSN
jgi:hypothetical protein